MGGVHIRQSERSESRCFVSGRTKSKTAQSTLRLRPSLRSSLNCAQGDAYGVDVVSIGGR